MLEPRRPYSGEAARDALDIAQARVYATSMGGRVAQMLVAHDPSRMSLVLACTSPGGARLRAVRACASQPCWAEPTERANNGGTEAVNGLIELHRRIARAFCSQANYRLRMIRAAATSPTHNSDEPHSSRLKGPAETVDPELTAPTYCRR